MWVELYVMFCRIWNKLIIELVKKLLIVKEVIKIVIDLCWKKFSGFLYIM